jgi:hypothetical protein
VETTQPPDFALDRFRLRSPLVNLLLFFPLLDLIVRQMPATFLNQKRSQFENPNPGRVFKEKNLTSGVMKNGEIRPEFARSVLLPLSQL